MNTLRIRTSKRDCANRRQQTYTHNLSLSFAHIQHMKIMQRDEKKNVKIASRLEGQDTSVENEKRGRQGNCKYANMEQ
jgi:hypothetical protein